MNEQTKYLLTKIKYNERQDCLEIYIKKIIKKDDKKYISKEKIELFVRKISWKIVGEEENVKIIKLFKYEIVKFANEILSNFFLPDWFIEEDYKKQIIFQYNYYSSIAEKYNKLIYQEQLKMAVLEEKLFCLKERSSSSRQSVVDRLILKISLCEDKIKKYKLQLNLNQVSFEAALSSLRRQYVDRRQCHDYAVVKTSSVEQMTSLTSVVFDDVGLWVDGSTSEI